MTALLADPEAGWAVLWVIVPRGDVMAVTRKEEGTLRALQA